MLSLPPLCRLCIWVTIMMVTKGISIPRNTQVAFWGSGRLPHQRVPLICTYEPWVT